MSPRRNWDSPDPSPASECALPPPDQRVGENTRLRLWGSQFRRLEKKLSTLPTLWPLLLVGHVYLTILSNQ